MPTGSPGPAGYNISDTYNKLKPKIPSVKITGRPVDKNITFGPGPTHKYTIPGRKPPSYSFGRKHAEYVGNYILPEDNACLSYSEPCA